MKGRNEKLLVMQRTKAHACPVRADNRWQRQAELSPKKNYVPVRGEPLTVKFFLGLDLILTKGASIRLSVLTGQAWVFWWLVTAGKDK